jgi:biopolymer transport protein ExbB/TolQ
MNVFYITLLILAIIALILYAILPIKHEKLKEEIKQLEKELYDIISKK